MLSLTWCDMNLTSMMLCSRTRTGPVTRSQGSGRSDHCWCSLKPVCVISGDCTGMHMASCVIYKSSLALPHAGTPVVKGTPPENPLKLQSKSLTISFGRVCVCDRITCMSKLLFPQGIAVSNPISTQYAHNSVREKQCLHWTSSQRDALLLSSYNCLRFALALSKIMSCSFLLRSPLRRQRRRWTAWGSAPGPDPMIRVTDVVFLVFWEVGGWLVCVCFLCPFVIFFFNT